MALKKSFVFLLMFMAYFLYLKMHMNAKSSRRNGERARENIMVLIRYIVELFIWYNPPFIVYIISITFEEG